MLPNPRQRRTGHRAVRRTGTWLLATIGAVGALLIVALGPAHGHSDLVGSTPVAGADLRTSPERILLVFSGDVSPQFVQLVLRVGDEAPRPLDPRVDGPRVVADVPTGAPATGGDAVSWSLAYRVVSADGHPITGQLTFRAPPPATADGSARPSASSSATTRDRSATPVVLVVGGLIVVVAGAVGFGLLRRRNEAPEA